MEPRLRDVAEVVDVRSDPVSHSASIYTDLVGDIGGVAALGSKPTSTAHSLIFHEPTFPTSDRDRHGENHRILTVIGTDE
jgi:hypothetical protein